MTRWTVPGLPTIAALVGVSLLALCAPARAGVLHSFTDIATADDKVFGSFSVPVINNSGRVAFSGTLVGQGASGVFTSTGGALTTVAGPNQNLDARIPDINNAGTVAFFAQEPDGTTSIRVRKSGGPIVQVARENTTIDTDGNLITRIFTSRPGIRDGVETVVFIAESAGREVNYASAEPYSSVFDLKVREAPIDFFGAPVISPDGVVTTFVKFLSGREIIEVSNLGTIADTNGSLFADLSSALDINAHNTVLFPAELDSGIEGIYRSAGLGNTTVADDTGGFMDFFAGGINSASASDPGVAFTAVLDGFAAVGVFAGPDPIADKVLVTGDVLFGKTVLSAGLGAGGLNDAEQKAIDVHFTDGTEKIVRASPLVFIKAGDLEHLAQITTGAGSGAAMSQDLEPPDAADASDLSFDYRFLRTTGELSVLLGGVLVDTVMAPDVPTREFTTFTTSIDLRDLFPTGIPRLVDLVFELLGPAGSTVQLDNVVYEGSSLVNGDFQTGYMDGWTFDTSGGGAVAAVASQFTFAAPEPGTVLLHGLGLIVLAASGRGRGASARRRARSRGPRTPG